MLLVVQNSTKPFNIYFGVSGLTVTATMSKNGGSFNAVSPTITDRSNGYYSITPLAAHRDTIGENAWLFAASGQPSLPRVEQVGLSNVDTVALGALQPTVAGRTLDVTATGAAGIDWGNIENIATVNYLSQTSVVVESIAITAARTIGAIFDRWAVVSATSTTATVTFQQEVTENLNRFIGCTIFVESDELDRTGQPREITSVVAGDPDEAVVTIDRAWDYTPSEGSTLIVRPDVNRSEPPTAVQIADQVETRTLDANIKQINDDASFVSSFNLQLEEGFNVAIIQPEVITANSIAAGALDGKGNWNVGKTGYVLTSASETGIADAVWGTQITSGNSASQHLARITSGVADLFTRLATMIEDSTGWRWTAKALEQGPVANVSNIETKAEADTRQTALLEQFVAVKGATFDTATDSLEAIRNRGDAAWTGGGGDATEAKQDTILAAIADIEGVDNNDPNIVIKRIIVQSGGQPISGVFVSIHDDPDTDTPLKSGTTNSSGYLDVPLDIDTTYYIYRYHPLYQFTNPVTLET